jgi:hypothetical protein
LTAISLGLSLFLFENYIFAGMDLGEIFDQIKKRWTSSERYELIAKLDDAPRGAATGGEGMSLYAGFLLELKKSDPNAFDEIADLVDEFAKENAAYGAIIKGYNYKPYWRS